MLAYSQRQTLEIEVFQRFFHRKSGSLDQADDLVGPADIAFYLGKLVQVLLVAESFAHCFDGVFGVILTEHRQMKLFEQFGQLFTQVLFHAVITS